MAEEPSTKSPEPGVISELRTLVGQAQAGDVSALPRIRNILDEHPTIWHHLGDLSTVARKAWIAVLAAANPAMAESVKRQLGEMESELAGAHPTRLERMLVDQVLMCWMELTYLQTISADPPGGSLEQAKFRLRQLESAERRHANAIKTLAILRSRVPAGLAPAQSIRLHEEKARKLA